MPPSDAYQGVVESLQADVMRFMAIIAFCLMAILALVRSAEPAPAAPPQTSARQSERPPDAPAAALTAAVPEPAPTAASARAAEPAPGAAAPEAAATAPTPRAPDAPVVASAPPAAPPAATAAAPDPAPPAAAPADAAERGLVLRFASDQDFLRLLNRGEIRLFAFHDGDVLSVASDLRLEPATAPPRLHELLPDTIPELLGAALRGARATSAYRWGVAMPARMDRRIREYVDQGASGELVIDRFGEVRLHGA